MKLHEEDSGEIVSSLDLLATSRGYSKIFAKVPAWARERFHVGGYAEEARIPGFYPGGEDLCFMGKYFTESRAREQASQLVSEVLAVAGTTAVVSTPTPLPSDFAVRTAREEDGEEMAKIYREVFVSYPFRHRCNVSSRQFCQGYTKSFSSVEDGDRYPRPPPSLLQRLHIPAPLDTIDWCEEHRNSLKPL